MSRWASTLLPQRNTPGEIQKGILDLLAKLNGEDDSLQAHIAGQYANPTASVGLTVVNGVATTAMRSDASPPLSVAISPTWTATHTFTLAPVFSAMTAGSVLFAGAAGILSQDNARLFWDNTNKRLGIGTATPSTVLEVRGTTGLALSNANVAHGVTNYFATDVYGYMGIIDLTAGGNQIWGLADTVDKIGLDLHGVATTGSTTIAAVRVHGYIANGVNLTVVPDANILFDILNSTTSKFTIMGSGNVGIGTATPAYLGHFNVPTGTCAIALSTADGGGYQIIRFLDATVAEWHIGRSDADNSFRITESGVADSMIFLPGGKVGILMSPTYTLDVTGNFRCSTGFGCNGATPQTAYATVAAAAYTTGAFGLNSDANMKKLYDLVVAMRAALVANGICS